MSNYTFWKDENGVSEFLLPKQQKDMALFGQTGSTVIPCALQLDHAVDMEKMEKAIQSVFDSYSILRSLVYINDGTYYYRIIDNYKYKLLCFEIDGETQEEKFANLQKKISEITAQPVDLTKDVSLKIGLLKMAEEQYVLYFVGPPFAVDGTAAMVAIRKIMSNYLDKPSDIPESIQYHEFAKRCIEYEQSDKGKKDQKFWDDELAGYETYNIEKWFEGRKADIDEFNQPLDCDVIKEAAKKYRTSVYNIVLLGMHIAIHISLGINDSTVVVPSSCRMKKDEMYTVGNLARYMPQRMTFDTDVKLSDLMDKSIRKLSECLMHHHAASKVLSCQVTLSCNNYRGGQNYEYKMLTKVLGNDHKVTRDQIVTLVDLDDQLSLHFGFDHRVSYETLCFITNTVQLTAKLLLEQPDITVAKIAEMLGR